MTRTGETAGFAALSLLVCAIVFRGAMWGGTLLAPLDILPDAFLHYRFMDPEADGVPENHHIIDQITYDLPLQHLIYSAYRSGDIPWWDPYTYGGRPLLADAHINGTDPIRLLCYFTLPFELAYNWNLILKSLLTGVGMFLLLRHISVPFENAIPLSLAYQFAGCFAVFFGHPWIQGSFLYYPLLWLALDIGLTRGFWRSAAVASLLSAAIFYSGNLQSHLYLGLFFGGILIGVAASDSAILPRATGLLFLTGGTAVLLAAPVLLNQIEFYFLSTRAAAVSSWSWQDVLIGPCSLSAAYPWIFGTFKTIDLSKIVRSGSLGFVLFTGTSVTILAVVGIVHALRTFRSSPRWQTSSTVFVLGYFILVSTPVVHLLYTRSSALAVLAIVLLAGHGLQIVAKWDIATSRRFGIALLIAVSAFVICIHGGLIVYSQWKPTITDAFLTRVEANDSSLASRALRTLQVERFSDEVGLKNPEALASIVSAILLGIAAVASSHRVRRAACIAAVSMAAFSAILFFSRYIPAQPIELWNALRQGGSAQKNVIAMASPQGSRVQEVTTKLQDFVFPNAMGALYRLHTVHGYSALQPVSMFRFPQNVPPAPSDWIADISSSNTGVVSLTHPIEKPGSRLRWDGPAPRGVEISGETANTLSVVVQPGAAGKLIRTDTYYPGWTVSSAANGVDASVKELPPCFSWIHIGESVNPLKLVFRYEPRLLRWGTTCAIVGIVGVVAMLYLSTRERRII